ncbi:hypothetical protein HHI36_005668 [Cryptolaemus montrouzieri]|uniref:Protein shuttle craft n=1 Tax=Cryptolaemus montrouzieri TaxID=559131 RepID=A0ABD2NWF5_9CUCU
MNDSNHQPSDQILNLNSNIDIQESTETSGNQAACSGGNHQNNKGAIKKIGNHNRKDPKEKFYRNNHRFKNNGTHSKYTNRTFNEGIAPQQNHRNSHQSQNFYESSVLNDTRPRYDQLMYQRNHKHNYKNYDNNMYYGNFNGHKTQYRNNFHNDRNGYDNNWQMQLHYIDNHSKENSSGFEHKYRDEGKNQQFPRNRQQKYNNKNWRMNYSKQRKMEKKVDIASQRGRLEEMIKNKTLECLVCCEIFKYNDKIWSCKQCYHILHLKCIQAWANSSKEENGWRCPACQNVCKNVPQEYRCFCEKIKEPKNEPGLIPHSCGDVCLKVGRNCSHRCLILCHPGPCPDCTVLINKLCGCGRTEQQVKCSSDIEIVCLNNCEKILECGLHKCDQKCHAGDCKPCEEILKQTCFCGKEDREVACTLEFQGKNNFSCQKPCDKLLSCGNHKCIDVCHEGTCTPCRKDISVIKTCFCGKTLLQIARISCLDPVPSCGLLCHKTLKCGPTNAPHICKSLCHDGDCPSCDLTTVLKCRCGFMDKEIPCGKLTTKADDARCEKKCTKKRLCGKHKCNQRCCIEIEHICPLPCNHLLSCGNHRCELTCHSGRCKPCTETSFEELYCECGASVLYPPIPCGTKPPICNEPCVRERDCGHEVNHSCHTGPCPPCTILCKRWCYGGHEQRGTIPCHQENFSCGLACGKGMPCGKHKCNKPCHLGPCPLPCKQPCTFKRALCGHPCSAPCHEVPCPETNCKSKVPVQCPCGLQKGTKSCNEVIEEIRSIEMALLSEKMLNMSRNQSVDISDISKPKRPDVLKILECTEECRLLERNRRLAIGLQIRNPDITQKLTPRYSDFMRGWAKKDPHFCHRVHDKLTELVQLAKQSKQKSRSYSFESMNRDKRHFIHEYCEHFGCESAAYDAEPNRNIVATAIRDKSWLPSMSLMEVIQRENGQRKVPGPSILDRSSCSNSESVALKSMNRSTKLGVQINDVNYLKK